MTVTQQLLSFSIQWLVCDRRPRQSIADGCVLFFMYMPAGTLVTLPCQQIQECWPVVQPATFMRDMLQPFSCCCGAQAWCNAKPYSMQHIAFLLRHTTIYVQAKLEMDVEREKALAEAEGRTRENRENEDINRRAMQLRLEEERKKLVEAINTTFSNVGAGTMSLLTDRDRLGTAVAGLTLLALGVYSAREGTRVAGQVFSR